MHFGLWVVIFGAAWFIVPRYVEQFEAYSLALPDSTIWVIELSWWAHDYWYAVVMAGLVALMLDWIILASLGKLGWVRVTVAGVLLALIPLLLSAFGVLAIRLPLGGLP